MATIREYFDGDFSYTTRVKVKLEVASDTFVEAAILYDFTALGAFLALWVGGHQSIEFFRELVTKIKFGTTELQLDHAVVLPAIRFFPGQMRIDNASKFDIKANFFGDSRWTSMNEITTAKRVFVYSETALSASDRTDLTALGDKVGINLQFRGPEFAAQLSQRDKPLAFICDDSRDKDEVARKIAAKLQQMLCPVWYDEYSLTVGDNLRLKIEQGLKASKKCILVLSPSFFSNTGWSRKEFDSIFTREIVEATNVMLPVWYGVTKQMVFDYSPSLLNVKGIDWAVGVDEVCRQLFVAITNQ